MPPLRVVYFLSEYHRLHGAQRSSLQLLRGLPAVGVAPLAVFPGEGLATSTFREAGVEVCVLPGGPLLSTFGQGLLSGSKLRTAQLVLRDVLPYSARIVALARREGARILHAGTPRSTLLSAPLAKAGGLRVVSHLRGLLTPFPRAHRVALAAASDRIVCVAEGLEQEIPAPFRGRCRVIPNGIDDGSLPYEDAPLLREHMPGAPCVITVSSLSPAKGIHDLVEAAALLRHLRPTPRFLFVGAFADPAYEAYIRARIAELGLDNVALAGYSERPRAYYEAADVVVLASVVDRELRTPMGTFHAKSGEGLPRTLLEAMYLRRAIVATDVAGVRQQIVDGETGLVVPEADPPALARAIERLLDDAALRARFGENARARIDARYSADLMVSRVNALYRELLR